jgi:hypothetical protein
MFSKARLKRLQREMKARLHAERLAPARAERERLVWEAGHVARKREGYAAVAMGCVLRASERRMKRERYVTAILGVRTSWPRIIEHAKYAVCSESRA